jgi:acyl carrier protein
MPLTPNGKIDRKALPVIKVEPRVEEIATAQSEMERRVAQIWQDLLELDQISIYDNFFDLGGHSMMAMQVITRMAEQTGIRVDPAFIRFQTLGQLAAHYEQASPDPISSEEAPAGSDGHLPSKLFRALRRAVSTK